MNYLGIALVLVLSTSVPSTSEANEVTPLKRGVTGEKSVLFEKEAFSSRNRTKRHVSGEENENGSRLERGVSRSEGAGHDKNEEVPGVHVVSWRWDHVGVFVTITLFIVLSGLAKVGE